MYFWPNWSRPKYRTEKSSFFRRLAVSFAPQRKFGFEPIKFLEVKFWISLEPGETFAAAQTDGAIGFAVLFVNIRNDLTGIQVLSGNDTHSDVPRRLSFRPVGQIISAQTTERNQQQSDGASSDACDGRQMAWRGRWW